MRKTKTLIVIALLLMLDSFAENRYWVGGSGNWDGIAGLKWATSSGGAGGAAIPTYNDDVFFDLNSGAVVVANTGNNYCNKIDFTGFKGTFAGSGSVLFKGDATLSANMIMTYTGSFNSAGNGTQIFTSNGVIQTNAVDAGNGSSTGILKFADNFISTFALTLNSGILDVNNKNVTILNFVSNNTNPRILNMGSGVWILTGSGIVWNTSTSGNLTLNPNTSTIKLVNNSSSLKNFRGGNLVFYNFWNATSGSGAVLIEASNNTFNDIKIDAGRRQQFASGTTTTLSSLTAVGTSTNPIIIESDILAQHWLSKPSGIVNVQYCNIHYSNATGGAIWCAGPTSGNNGNNTGWLFGNCTTVGVSESKNNDSYSIYPNPFSCVTTLHTEESLVNATLTVYNSLGQVVKEIKDISGDEIVLHRDDLSDGLYFISVNQNNEILFQNKLFIKNN